MLCASNLGLAHKKQNTLGRHLMQKTMAYGNSFSWKKKGCAI